MLTFVHITDRLCPGYQCFVLVFLRCLPTSMLFLLAPHRVSIQGTVYKIWRMAAIPAGGSLVATHDYYRSMHRNCFPYKSLSMQIKTVACMPLKHHFNSCCLSFIGRIGSTSSNSSCSSSEYSGEVIPHHPGEENMMNIISRYAITLSLYEITTVVSVICCA